MPCSTTTFLCLAAVLVLSILTSTCHAHNKAKDKDKDPQYYAVVTHNPKDDWSNANVVEFFCVESLNRAVQRHEWALVTYYAPWLLSLASFDGLEGRWEVDLVD